MSYTYENKTGSPNWNQPCTVTVKLNDLETMLTILLQ